MDITMKVYLDILHRISEAEKTNNYFDLLYYSLEGLTYISNITHLNNADTKTALNSLDYLIRYLAVLQEEKELKNILKIINRYSPGETFSETAQKYIAVTNILYSYLKKNPGCKISDLSSRLENQKLAQKLISSALQLQIIEQKGNLLYLTQKAISLKAILTS